MEKSDNQVLYNGRWIPKEHFRAFVYSNDGMYLAKNYEEYARLISSGTYFAEPQSVAEDSEDVADIVKNDNEKVVSMQGAERGKKCRNQVKT